MKSLPVKNSGAGAPGPADPFHDPAYAHLPEFRLSDIHFRPQRRKLLPVALFVATCASTLFVGSASWKPQEHLHSWTAIGRVIWNNWQQGVVYMGAVLAILLTHEMGHFWQTVRHRIAASYPLCIPVPFNAIGTMGAVIGMDGMKADRRQIFDIGIAGPLAGLVVAVPVLWIGIRQLQLGGPVRPDDVQLYLPVIGHWMMQYLHPEWAGERWIPISQVNAYFMAGWVGMLITGLNMLPVSQLDGGHTIYALFLDRAHTIARMFISFAIFYVVINLDDAVLWTPMLVLVILMGIHHPRTADDDVELGPTRWAIGIASLAIPVVCFPMLGFRL
ncbi:site-2 protease family protein [Pirellulales bacterium]|nr:site-2 protease family protein [Pirellulales bacterium]